MKSREYKYHNRIYKAYGYKFYNLRPYTNVCEGKCFIKKRR